MCLGVGKGVHGVWFMSLTTVELIVLSDKRWSEGRSVLLQWFHGTVLKCCLCFGMFCGLKIVNTLSVLF